MRTGRPIKYDTTRFETEGEEIIEQLRLFSAETRRMFEHLVSIFSPSDSLGLRLANVSRRLGELADLYEERTERVQLKDFGLNMNDVRRMLRDDPNTVKQFLEGDWKTTQV